MGNHQQVVKNQKRFKGSLRGSYLLILHLNSPLLLSTRKKKFKLSSGYYIYVGSAMNSLLGRVKHHERRLKKPFWHIDFLLEHASLRMALLIPCLYPLESYLSSRISGQPVPHFGSTDVKDPSHLFHYKRFEEAIVDALRVGW